VPQGAAPDSAAPSRPEPAVRPQRSPTTTAHKALEADPPSVPLDAVEVFDDDEPVSVVIELEPAAQHHATQAAGVDLRETRALEALDTSLPVAELVEEDEPALIQTALIKAEPAPLRKKKKRKPAAEPAAGGATALIAVAVAAGLWLTLSALTFLSSSMVWGLLLVGGLLAVVGRLTFLTAAKNEGTGAYIACLLVPFYSIYFFFTHLDETLKPFLIWLVGLVYLGTGGVLWFVHAARDHRPVGAALQAAGDGDDEGVNEDATCQQLLKGPNKAEARAWLKDPNLRRGIFKRSRQWAQQLIEDLYERGAKEVFVVNIENLEGMGEIAAQLVVVLPDDPAKRLGLLQWKMKFEEEEEGAKPKDHGQKYMLVNLD
jgi:hypothetical protein